MCQLWPRALEAWLSQRKVSAGCTGPIVAEPRGASVARAVAVVAAIVNSLPEGHRELPGPAWSRGERDRAVLVGEPSSLT